MSNPSGDAKIVGDVVAGAKALLMSERAEELRQLDLLDPPTPEEMLEARADLGRNAGRLAVVAHAREKKRGRPLGARNKRSDDFAAYILQNGGADPAIFLGRAIATPTEVLMEASGKSYLECYDRQIRCAEALQPYFHSKKPVAVDLSFAGVADLFIEGVTHSREEIGDIIDADYLPVDDAGGGTR